MDSARQELLEAQKERSALMKWKLILVSAIGAASLGFSQKTSMPHAELALTLIPFSCIYVDILCRNLSIRTKMISRFLAHQGDLLEAFYLGYKGPRGISLESLALRYSTGFLSLTIVPVGIIAYFGKPFASSTWLQWQSFLFYFSGIYGNIAVILD